MLLQGDSLVVVVHCLMWSGVSKIISGASAGRIGRRTLIAGSSTQCSTDQLRLEIPGLRELL